MKELQLRTLYLLAFLLLVLVMLAFSPILLVRPAGAAEEALVVAGSYTGSVIVSSPAPLGSLHLQLDITNAGGALTGQVNAIKTQVFLGGPTFTGNVAVTQNTTPTVRIESQVFSGVVSGRTVQRHFVLTGEVLNEGDLLRGNYTETIVGFKVQPMFVSGTFLLSRPNGVTAIIAVPTPKGSTPVPTPTPPGPGTTPAPTATPTRPPNNATNAKVFLPLVNR